ncbi:MAG: F0F1 ATP synthase subunit gamma [Alphaproteobacteria bacterium]|nr:F0F1 ATP synthase subunit gamma [Alphaproteobacteria bacterium]
MTRLSEIEGHIASMSELFDIVGAMRAMAGMRMQEAQRALPGVRRYADAVATAIAASLLLLEPARPAGRAARQRRALVLCAAEHGFVGGFNERLYETAEAVREPDDVLFILGSRGGTLAAERQKPATWTQPMATRCAAVPDAVHRLSTELYRRIAQDGLVRVEVIHARYRQGGASTVERRALLPLDTAALQARRPRQAPLHNLQPAALSERLLEEYVFALLTEAAVESIASENAARFAAMESAHDNVARRLDGLRHDAREARQSETTMELIELATAGKALDSRHA